jgi:TRAP-type C4-dicarboxylate transport system permease large subunit
MWLLVGGITLLVMTAVWQSYCLIGGRASPSFAPAIFWSSTTNILLQLSWIVLLIVGFVMLFFTNWVAGIVAIPVYFFVLRVLIAPRTKKWILGTWDENKDVLEGHGYDKDNYLDGDWWKRQG